MKKLDLAGANFHSCPDMYFSSGSPRHGKNEEYGWALMAQSYLSRYHSTHLSQPRPCVSVSLISQPNSVCGSVGGVSTLAPTPVVSDLLSHSRRHQRAEPTLQGLATHSGTKADVSSKCLFAYQVGLLLPFPFFSVLLPSGEWQCPQNHMPSELGWKTFSPGIWPNLCGTHLFFWISHGSWSFICRKEA